MIASVTYRDLSTLDDFRAVVDLESRIWGVEYSDVVPVPILAVTVHRGAVLIGAFAGGEMIGFVYSLPGLKHGRAMQWSHMLGVVSEYRSAGIGHQLKLLQRERTLAAGLDLVEWTYDPLQAANAHLNFVKLGVVAHEYLINVYGESSSPLHRGNPTDRFVAEWHLGASAAAEGGGQRGDDIAAAPAVNRVERRGEWIDVAAVDLSLDAPSVSVAIPIGFTEMLAAAPERAIAWRMTTRDIFTTYFERGYHAAAFALDQPARTGRYLLVRK